MKLEDAATQYAKTKKLEIGGIDTWAFIQIFTDGAKWQAEQNKDRETLFAEWLNSPKTPYHFYHGAWVSVNDDKEYTIQDLLTIYKSGL